MPKKKEIKNYNPDMISRTNLFNKNNVEPIKSQYDFHTPPLELAEQLNDALTYYQCDKQNYETTPNLSKQKKYLKKMQLSSEDLKLSLENMGINISLNLIRANSRPISDTFIHDLLERLKVDLKNLTNLLIIAIHEIPKDKGSRPPSNDLKILILSLALIYNKGTSKNATCGWDDINERYVGEFYKFSTEIIELSQIKHKIQDLGKFISRSLSNSKNLTKK